VIDRDLARASAVDDHGDGLPGIDASRTTRFRVFLALTPVTGRE
jgi:hypothetical protein